MTIATTSRDAARSIVGVASQLRERVAAHIRRCGALGANCDEIESATGLLHQTASARVRELYLANRITDRGDNRRYRPTRSGRKAVVWIIAEPMR